MSRPGFLTLPHPLTNFEIQIHYQSEPNFKGVYSRNNLPKIKDGAYVRTLNEYKSIGAHWRTYYVEGDKVINFDSSGVEHIPKERGNRKITTNIYEIQSNDSIKCGHFCIEFFDFMLKG